MNNKRSKQNKILNQSRNNITYRVNDFVLLKANNKSDKENKIFAKFLEIYHGPFIISKVVDVNTYILNFIDTNEERGMFHGEHLKLYEK